MPKYKMMDKSKTGYNSSKMSGSPKGAGVMKNHGNTQKIAAYKHRDMGKENRLGHESKGYNEKAFNYKY